MIKPDTPYYISGEAFSKEELINYCKQKLTDEEIKEFEKDIFQFILDWFSPSDYMELRTSGSTGKPKKIRLQKKHMKASARTTISFFDLKPKDKIWNCLPMHFIAGKMMVVRALVGGLDLYIVQPSSKPDIFPNNVSFTAMIPLQVSNLMKDDESRKSFSKIDKLIVGGSFISVDLVNQLRKIATQVWQTYGMTETITHIALRKINGNNKSDWYKTLPGVSVKLDNRGCLIISTEHLGVGNLITNDLAEINETGEFKIKGRVDNIIISGSIKFNPEEIESKLSGTISNDYFIGGVNDNELGQKMVLFIEDEGILKRKVFDLWEMIEGKLAKLEIPKEIFFVSSFNRTASGKIDRKATISSLKK